MHPWALKLSIINTENSGLQTSLYPTPKKNQHNHLAAQPRITEPAWSSTFPLRDDNRFPTPAVNGETQRELPGGLKTGPAIAKAGQ